MSQFPHVLVCDSRGMKLCWQAVDRIVCGFEIYRGVFAHYAGWD
jgi:hypothetical protein